jgi:hypothetical protein
MAAFVTEIGMKLVVIFAILVAASTAQAQVYTA